MQYGAHMAFLPRSYGNLALAFCGFRLFVCCDPRERLEFPQFSFRPFRPRAARWPS